MQTETDLGGRTDTYTSDSLYRFIEQAISDPSSGNSSYVFAYDLVGNRVSETDTTSSGTVTQNSIYDANESRPGSRTPARMTSRILLRPDGNTIKVEDGDGTVLST